MVRPLILAILAGCGGDSRFEPCAGGEPLLLEGPGRIQRSDRRLVADAAGYVALWSSELQEGNPEQGGIKVARPGSAPRRYRSDANAQELAVATVQGGFLACWNPNCAPITEPMCRSGCLLLDHGLDVVRDWRPDFGTVQRFARVGEDLYALSFPDSDPAPVEWSRLDERGDRVGAASTAPCTDPWAQGRAGWMAWSSLGVACLVRSDPSCGRQFDEPADCTYGLELRDPDGTLTFSLPAIAPFGSYGSLILATVAARDDGFLFGWTDRNGAWHGLPISPDGIVGAPIDFPEASHASITPVDAGYFLAWTGLVDMPREYRWPMRAMLGPRGEILSAPAPIAEPREDIPFQYADPITVASVGGGVAVAWEAHEDTVDYPSALLYRSLGCLP